MNSDHSILDGFGQVHEYAERATKINQKYLCITDHGMMGAVPSQIRACEAHKINPLFGIEFYYQPNHPGKSALKEMDAQDKLAIKKSYHLTAVAYNKKGFENLIKASSWGWTEGFYYKPRINHKILSTHTEGITFFSGCYNSEVGQAFDKYGPEAADIKIQEYMKLFGEHFYLEIILLDFAKQKPYNKYLIGAAEKFNLPIVVTLDCHYCQKEDSKYQRYTLMIQKKTTIADIEKKLAEDDKAEIFEHQDTNLWFKSEEELNQKWIESYQEIVPYDIFTMAKENTVKIAQKSAGIEIDRSIKLPYIENADEELKEKVIEGMKYRKIYDKKEYRKQIVEEIDLIKRKGFSSYFLIQKKIVDEARKVSSTILGYGDGSEAVGPGRGCLKHDTLIPTENGIKKISEINVGDKVYTRDGSLQKVLKTMNYECKEDLKTIYTHCGDYKGISLTNDHLILSEINTNDPCGNLEWIRSDKLKVDDWLFIPNINEYELSAMETNNINNIIANKETTLFTSEIELASRTRLMLLSIGVPCSFNYSKKTKGYKIEICKNNNNYRKIKDGILVKVKKIKSTKNSKRVYDLEIEKNHNYLTNSFIVHNSAVGSLVCYCLGITDIDPIQNGLLFSRFLSESRGGRLIRTKFTKPPILTN